MGLTFFFDRMFPLKTGKVVPIFKIDERHECGNYRPISILYLHMQEFFRKPFADQLFDYFDSNNLLCDEQWGFRRKLSTIYLLCRKV